MSGNKVALAAVLSLMVSSKRTPLILVAVALLLSACQGLPGGRGPALQQLRITNSGHENIKSLVVLFPGKTADAQAVQVEFGNVPAGTTTEYREVPSGVYGYAAYRYSLGGRELMQPVVDWVGETPMQGQKFTYQIALDSTQVEGRQIELIKVLVDQP